MLIIGAFASGLDITVHLSSVAKSVTLSQNKPKNETQEDFVKRQNSFPEGTILKNIVKRFFSNGAEFVDGTRDTFTAVIYATGKNDIEFYLIKWLSR